MLAPTLIEIFQNAAAPLAAAPTVPASAAGTPVGTLPLGLHAPAVVGLIAGLILWSLGARMIKLALALVGAAAGAVIGSLLVPTVGLTSVAGFPAHGVGLVAGTILGLVAAILLFRFAMVVAGAGVLGAAAALAGLVYVNIAPPPPDLRAPDELSGLIEWSPESREQSPPESVDDPIREALSQEALAAGQRQAQETADRIRDSVGEDTAAAIGEAAERIRAFVRGVWGAFLTHWNGLDAAQRLVLAGFVVIGLAAGALVGLAMPTRSAAMITSLAGSAVWLTSLAWLAEAMRLPGREFLIGAGSASARWLIIWPIIAIIGLVFQLRNLKKPPEPTRRRESEGAERRSERRDRD